MNINFVCIALCFSLVLQQMARDTEGILGKMKEKEKDVKAEKVVKEEHTGMG